MKKAKTSRPKRSSKPSAPKNVKLTLDIPHATFELLKERSSGEGISPKTFALEGIRLRFEYKQVRRLVEIDSTDRFPFGKYKDFKLRDVPIEYLRWALAEASSMSEEFRERIRCEVSNRELEAEKKGQQR